MLKKVRKAKHKYSIKTKRGVAKATPLFLKIRF